MDTTHTHSTIRRTHLFLRRVLHYWPFAAIAAGVLVLSFTVYTLVVPQTIHFSYADTATCVGSPKLFPALFHTDTSETFRVTRPASFSIGHTPIYAARACATAQKAPAANAAYKNDEHFGFIAKRFSIVTTAYPKLEDVTSFGGQPLALAKPLTFSLSAQDSTFVYAVVANGKTAACTEKHTVLSCNLAPLQLGYGATYQASIARLFHSVPADPIVSKAIQTIAATAITQSSIASASIIYTQPQQLTLQTSKPLTAVQGVTVSAKNSDGTVSTVPSTSSFSGSTITVTFPNPLPRKANLDVHITNVTATDSSALEQPYDLGFVTSGGPTATNSNLPAYGLASGQSMTVSFSQALNPSQDPTQFASLLVNGTKQPATIAISGQKITIHPTGTYPVCAKVTIQLTGAAQNAYGVSGDSSGSFSTHSHCYSTFSIGTSVQGRPITAYQFGSGPSMVLYIAAMEGNEQNSAELMQQWIPALDANPGKIPTGRTIVVIPEINPDGFAADTRTNAAGIDLNRNFPANNWQTEVTEPLADTTWTNDGGPYPLSAPESQAIANYTEANKPLLTLTMHSHGGIVEANDAGNSIALGAQYAKLANYTPIPTYAIGNFFNYTTTGAYEDWMNDKLGLPALEVELESPTDPEVSRNLPALWAMAELPS